MDEDQNTVDTWNDPVDVSDENPNSSALSILSAAFDPSTTKEAQSYARKFLDKQLTADPEKGAQGIFERMEANAEQARQALKAAREKIASRKYGNAEALLSASAAFGAPTKSGRFGETLGNVAASQLAPLQHRREFEQGQDKDVLSLDTALSNVDNNVLNAKLGLMKITSTNDAQLSKEALKMLGRPLAGGKAGDIPTKAQEAVDRTYAKDYVDFIQGGAADAVKSLEELGNARDKLQGFKIGPNGQRVEREKNDDLTGPVVGTISTLPLIGKPIQDLVFPESANTQEMVEATVQRSLRPILGPQFTEKEGERLISRVYNPRLDEKTNAVRLDRLLNQLKRAYENKVAAANYFQKHSTLLGFKGKTRWTVDDFAAPGTLPGDRGYKEGADVDDRADDDLGYGFDVDGSPRTKDDVTPAGGSAPSKVLRFEDLPLKKRKFAGGGSVSDRVRYTMEDGTVIEAPKGTTKEQVVARYLGTEEPETPDMPVPPIPVTGPVANNVPSSEILGAAGYGTGASLLAGLGAKYGVQGALKLGTEIPGLRATKAEKALINPIERGGESLAEINTRLSTARKSGVPATMLDVAGPEVRGAAEDAIAKGGPEALDFLQFMKDRQSGARNRVEDVVNRGLKPDEYFQKEKDLKDALYSNAKPLYEQAYKAFPSMQSKQLFQLMNTPSGKKAVKKAVKAIQDKPGASIGKTNAMGMVTRPSLEFLDEVKKSFDDMISKEEGTGMNYKATGEGKRLRDLRNALVNEMDNVTSVNGQSLYTDARGQYAGDLEVLDALRTGRDEFVRSAPQEWASKLKNMSFTEKDAVRSGVAQKIFEVINNPSTDINPARKLAGSPATMAKLESVFDKPGQFKIFREALNREADLWENSRDTINKATNARSKVPSPEGSEIEAAMRKVKGLSLLSPVEWALNLFKSNPNLNEKQADEVVKMIRSGNPDELAALQNRIGSKIGRAATRKRIAGKAGVAGATLGAILGGYEGYQKGKEQDPVYEGLTPEQMNQADESAQFADGGKVKGVLQALGLMKTPKKGHFDDILATLRKNAEEAEAFKQQIYQRNPELKEYEGSRDVRFKAAGVSDLNHRLKKADGGKVRDFAAVAQILKAKQEMHDLIDPIAARRVPVDPASAEKIQTQYLKGLDRANSSIDDPSMMNMQGLESALLGLRNLISRYLTPETLAKYPKLPEGPVNTTPFPASGTPPIAVKPWTATGVQ